MVDGEVDKWSRNENFYLYEKVFDCALLILSIFLKNAGYNRRLAGVRTKTLTGRGIWQPRSKLQTVADAGGATSCLCSARLGQSKAENSNWERDTQLERWTTAATESAATESRRRRSLASSVGFRCCRWWSRAFAAAARRANGMLSNAPPFIVGDGRIAVDR